jgi:hypothetical protein
MLLNFFIKNSCKIVLVYDYPRSVQSVLRLCKFYVKYSGVLLFVWRKGDGQAKRRKTSIPLARQGECLSRKGRSSKVRRLSGAGLGVFFDVQNSLGAGFDANPAGNALAGIGFVRRFDHHMEGTFFNTFAAVDAKLLVDHVHALGILGDSPGFADLGTLAALRTGGELELFGVAGSQNVYAGQILCLGVFAFVESLGTGVLAGQAEHTTLRILNS